MYVDSKEVAYLGEIHDTLVKEVDCALLSRYIRQKVIQMEINLPKKNERSSA